MRKPPNLYPLHISSDAELLRSLQKCKYVLNPYSTKDRMTIIFYLMSENLHFFMICGEKKDVTQSVYEIHKTLLKQIEEWYHGR